MDFPTLGLVDCVMSLAIDESKVDHLAMALFNVKVVPMGEVRYLLLPGGVKVTINTEVTLKGVLDEVIIREFGPQIHNAISRVTEERVLGENRRTEGVSMMLTNNAHEGAVINLSLSIKGGVYIRNILYF